MIEDLAEMNRQFIEAYGNAEEMEREVRNIWKQLNTAEHHLEEATEMIDKRITNKVHLEKELTDSEHQQNEKEQQ